MAKAKKEANPVRDNFYPMAAIIVVVIGVFLVINSPKNETVNNLENESTTAAVLNSEKPKNLAYRGQEGKTALVILKDIAEVEVTGEGENAFVTSINGYKPDINKEFWSFYVNGKMAEVGAGSYNTKSDDLIEWKLEEIKAQ